MSCALITGSNRGIGFAIARGLLGKGFEVIASARTLAKAEEAAAKLSPGGKGVHPLALDVTDDASIQAAAAKVTSDFGSLDVLINNAGIYPDKGFDILTIERERLHRTFDTNTFGPVRVTQAFEALLEKSKDARVIHVSSGYGQLDGLSGAVPSYCLSKLALDGVTIMHHQILGPKGIAVFAMCPGWVHTDMGGPDAPRTPDQGADTAVWLASEAPRSLAGRLVRDRQAVEW